MNRIPEVQNQEAQLERLRAQRYLYSCSKIVLGAQAILSGPVALAWSLAVLLSPQLKGIAALWVLVVFLCDFTWLTRLQEAWRERAAKIQELFDCDVLELPWNSVKAGIPPTPEEIHGNADKYIRADDGSTPVENWYPPAVGALPLGVARIVCQRANCWWDAEQ